MASLNLSNYGIIPTPRKVLKDLESKLMSPALTNQFLCQFNIPPIVKDYLVEQNAFNNDFQKDLVNISCSDASLPGSTLYTHDVNNVYPGVNERFAYARAYDDRASFVFYVDNQYYILRLFEAWTRTIVDDQYADRPARPGLERKNYFSRVRFPDGSGNPTNYTGYRSTIVIDKFEKDMGSQTARSTQGPKYLRYVFLEAYPIEINSVPVAYGQADILKCTVSFTYTRFLLESRSGKYGERTEPERPSVSGIPSAPPPPQPRSAPLPPPPPPPPPRPPLF